MPCHLLANGADDVMQRRQQAPGVQQAQQLGRSTVRQPHLGAAGMLDRKGVGHRQMGIGAKVGSHHPVHHSIACSRTTEQALADCRLILVAQPAVRVLLMNDTVLK